MRLVFEFYRFALPVFVFFSLFFLLHFHAPALYNDLCVKTTLNLVTLVFQETGDKTKKPSVNCGVIMHAQ